MKTVAVIAEYNPFHNGHAYHLQTAKAVTCADNCIVIMSGDYTQRGEPAVYNKYLRAKAALLGGADLVIELPVFFSAASAAYFARGAIDIINACGIADYLCFGAENADINALNKTALSLTDNDAAIIKKTQGLISKGFSYPRARAAALEEMGIATDLLNKPNNILAVEYLRALAQTGSRVIPQAVKRRDAAYHDTQIKGSIASATAVRNAVYNEETQKIKTAVPAYAYALYTGQTPHNADKMSQLFQYIIKTTDTHIIKKADGVTEGIEARILKAAERNLTIGDIISEVKTKRYTFTKIMRTILRIILNITCDDFKTALRLSPAYIRVLGFKKETAVLRELLKKAERPTLTNLKYADKLLSQEELYLLNKNTEASDIYFLTNNILKHKKNDYHTPMVII